MPQSSRTKAQNEDGVNSYNYNCSPDVDEDEDGIPFAYPDETMVGAVHASMAAAAADAAVPASRSTIVIGDEPHSSALLTATTTVGTAPLSPFRQYRGSPLEEFIIETVDLRNQHLDLTEIAEGERGSVHFACLNPLTASKLHVYLPRSS